MKKTLYKIFSIITYIYISIGFLSCSGDEPVSAALKGDTKLKEGDPVPFVLYQNEPNPFNPATTITFMVAQSLHLTLKIYTEDWQELTTLFDRYVTMPSSSQPTAYPSFTVMFNAQGLGSGIYYYVLEGGGYTQIRAMRLMK